MKRKESAVESSGKKSIGHSHRRRGLNRWARTAGLLFLAASAVYNGRAIAAGLAKAGTPGGSAESKTQATVTDENLPSEPVIVTSQTIDAHKAGAKPATQPTEKVVKADRPATQPATQPS